MMQEPQTYHAELTKRGIIRLKDKDMFTVWVKPECCNLSSGQMRVIADITDRYARGYLLFTTNQNAVIPFVHIKDVDKVLDELKRVSLRLDRCGPTVRNTKVCYDATTCPDAVTNCVSLANKLEVFFDRPLNHKTKIGVAGCEKDCISSRVLTDIGFVGTAKDGRRGYDVFVGGKLGLAPFIGVKLAACLSEDESVKFLENYFDFMNREGKPGERSADLIRRLGVERVRDELNRNLQRLPHPEMDTHLKDSPPQQDKVILKIRATLGQVTSPRLRKIADIAERYAKGLIHFPIRCYPEIPGVERRHLEVIRKELAQTGLRLLDDGIDNIQGCCFGGHCTENVMDPHPLLLKVERLVAELGLNNTSLSISASGCPNSCGFPQLSDIGFIGAVEPEVDTSRCNGCQLCVPVCRTKAIAMENNVAVIDLAQCKHCGQCIMACPLDAIVEKRKGFTVLAGGREGKDISLGEKIAEFLSEEEALRLTERALRLAKQRHAKLATIIEGEDLQTFKEMLTADI